MYYVFVIFCRPLFTKYFSGDLMKNDEMGGHVARMGKKRGAYRILVRKPKGKV
jgi:hypothetical protein